MTVASSAVTRSSSARPTAYLSTCTPLYANDGPSSFQRQRPPHASSSSSTPSSSSSSSSRFGSSRFGSTERADSGNSRPPRNRERDRDSSNQSRRRGESNPARFQSRDNRDGQNAKFASSNNNNNRRRQNQQSQTQVPRPRDWTRAKQQSRQPTRSSEGQDKDPSSTPVNAPEPESDRTAASDDDDGPALDYDDRLELGSGKVRNVDAKLRKKHGRGSLLATEPTHAQRERPSRREAQHGNQAEAKTQPREKANAGVKPKLKPVRTEVFLPAMVSVSTLARHLGVKLRTLQNAMTEAGMTDVRPDLILKFEDAEMLAAEFNLVAVINELAAFDIYPRDSATPEEYAKLPLRPPVVTIMGHVDHGKTTLLDKLRSTSVAAGEAGGITQHIGAFSVPVSRASDDTSAIRTVTFLDTPGHAAFTAMRSRGASVTDIVVLVVAADDGVMPQTQEVIDLVKSLSEGTGNLSERRAGNSSVQLVVALNKIDKPDAEPDRVKRELLAAGVELEEFAGEVPCVEVSGKSGEGLPELEETLATLAEIAELRAERTGPAEGYVIESKVDKGRGNVATVLVKRGQLKSGDAIIAGTAWCKVRQVFDSNNRVVKSAGPGDPVLVTGWRELPTAGDELLGAPDEASIKKAVENRKASAERRALMADVESINEQRRLKAEADESQARAEYEERQRRREARLAADSQGAVLSEGPSDETKVNEDEGEDADESDADAATPADYKQLNLIIKADFSGTVEAVEGAISGIGNREAGVKIISASVGEPTEGDVAKASALGGHIVGFNVKASKSVQQAAARAQPRVTVHCDNVIYRLMEHVSSSVAALLPPIIEPRVTGEATIVQIFAINVKGSTFRNIAGCRVTNGVIAKANQVRVLRGPDRKVIYEGRLDQLKQVKKDVPEMRKGTECGMSFEGFQDIQEGDIVQSFYTVEVPRTL